PGRRGHHRRCRRGCRAATPRARGAPPHRGIRGLHRGVQRRGRGRRVPRPRCGGAGRRRTAEGDRAADHRGSPMTRVDIIGAGVSGLALAGHLPPHWEVHLYEHRAQDPAVPTLFSIFPAGRAALAELGLQTALDSAGLAVDSGTFSDSRGRVLTRMDGLDVRLVPRPDLLTLLGDRLPANVRVHRRTVRSRADLVGSPDGTLVIGADGVHSGVRRAAWPARSAPRRLAATAVRGVIDEEDPEPVIQEIWRPGGAFGMTPRPGGGVNWYATLPRRRFRDSAEAIDALRARWAGAKGPAAGVLRHATPARTL